MSPTLKSYIEQLLAGIEHSEKPLWSQVSGGSINETFKIEFKHTSYFLKTNDLTVFSNGFQEEKEGLEFLAEIGARIPDVVVSGILSNEAFLVLNWIEEGWPTHASWTSFAVDLARMHRQTGSAFGLRSDNFMGSLGQINAWRSTYQKFFIDNRLLPQIEYANQLGILGSANSKAFELLFKRISDLIPEEPPAVVHGDLWSGNFITSRSEEVYLIDPAAHFGHREADLAMTKLFGGFDRLFYDRYFESFPVMPGFEDRVPIYNLYPLLIHLNLFGRSYLRPIEHTLHKFKA